MAAARRREPLCAPSGPEEVTSETDGRRTAPITRTLADVQRLHRLVSKGGSLARH